MSILHRPRVTVGKVIMNLEELCSVFLIHRDIENASTRAHEPCDPKS